MARDPQNTDDMFVPLDAATDAVPADVGLPQPRYFPPSTATTPDGLLCIGGKLSPDWLLDAYSHGIFPWPIWENEPMVWWSPDPRAIIPLDGFHLSRRLRRTIRSGKFVATCDGDFPSVIRGCATAKGRGRGNTWLTPSMMNAYCRLHQLGHAHSVEVWHDGQLAGGAYGVAIGGVFAAESMFTRVRDASKVAVAYLVAHLRSRGYDLLDVQQWTPHTGHMGAIEIPRIEYLRRLASAIRRPVTFGNELCGDPVREL